jgi:hypothetical protein
MMAMAIKLLIEAGVSGDGLVEAVARLEASADRRSPGAKRQARYRERSKAVAVSASDAAPLLPLCFEDTPPFADRVVTAWNLAAARAGLSTARALDGARKARLATRVKTHGEQAVFEAIANLSESRFHCGGNNHGWKATLGWLLESPVNFLKALELGQRSCETTAPPSMSAAERAAYLEQLDARPWANLRPSCTKPARPRPRDRGAGPRPIGALAGGIAAQAAA